ncbi:hypothetical protein ABTY96_28495 [Streptomyces sp. NPDC096057]|uniref:hypothetical protein n=1 Tax=Streptomyces sp. NPDC096057 TaxID=3155543 RepID=UPI00332D6729
MFEVSEAPYTPVLRLMGMFCGGESPSACYPAKERQACEYLAEYLLGSRDEERFEQLVTAMVNQ